MTINNSEVWFTFSASYKGLLFENIDILSNIILATGIANCVTSSEGFNYFIENKKIVKDKISYNFRDNTINTKNWPENTQLQKEIDENTVNYIFEKRVDLYSHNNDLNHNYIRCFLLPLVFEIEQLYFNVVCYVNIYMSGVIIIEFRILINQKISLENFINNFINISTKKFDKAYFCTKYIINNEILKDPDFKTQTLINTECTLIDAAKKICLNFEKEFNNFFEKIIKNKALSFETQQLWIGRPHIHILNFENAMQTSNENIEIYNHEINKLLNMNYEINKNNKVKDLREFDDFNYIINNGIFLSLWSKEGIEKHKDWFDLDREVSFYISNQIKNRFLSYYEILEKRGMYYISEKDSLDDLMHYKRMGYYLDSDMQMPSRTSEIKNIIDYSKKALHINERRKINENYFSDLINLKIDLKQKKLKNRITFLTIIFGIFSVSNLILKIAKAIWLYFGFPYFNNYLLNNITFNSLSIIILFAFAYLIYTCKFKE